MPGDIKSRGGIERMDPLFCVRTAIELIAVLVNLENNRIPTCSKIGVQFYHNVINYGIDIVNH